MRFTIEPQYTWPVMFSCNCFTTLHASTLPSYINVDCKYKLKIEYTCRKGWYGSSNTYCSPCPAGKYSVNMRMFAIFDVTSWIHTNWCLNFLPSVQYHSIIVTCMMVFVIVVVWVLKRCCKKTILWVKKTKQRNRLCR